MLTLCSLCGCDEMPCGCVGVEFADWFWIQQLVSDSPNLFVLQDDHSSLSRISLVFLSCSDPIHIVHIPGGIHRPLTHFPSSQSLQAYFTLQLLSSPNRQRILIRGCGFGASQFWSCVLTSVRGKVEVLRNRSVSWCRLETGQIALLAGLS